MQKPDRGARLCFGLTTLLYLILDLAVQLTGYLSFGPIVGLKNFIPATAGLFFGLYAVLGTCVGCVIGALILSTPWQYVAAECLANLIVGVGIWLLWYRLPNAHRPAFKTGRDLLRLLLLVLSLSACAALAALPLIGTDGAVRVFAAYSSQSLIVGLVVNILLSSILCVKPICPPGHAIPYDLSFSLTSSPESLIEVNESVEMAAMRHKVGMKRVFELESCLEELSIRVFKALPDTEIEGSILFSDTISLRLSYRGGAYNPFHIGPDEDELDILSLKLLRHRALRAAYYDHTHADRENSIHIVL